MIALNLGSGQRSFGPPFINTDIQKKWKEPTERAGHVWKDALDVQFMDDDSFDCIVLHHVLEHFGCGEATGLLNMSHRLLKPGGSLLVFVPNMRALAQRWLIGALDDYNYFVNVYGAYMGDEADRHKWGSSTKGWMETLEKSDAWKEVKWFDWRPIEGANLAKDWWITGLEAVK